MLSKLPCSSRSSFLCSEQAPWHCNGKKHLSLTHGCEKKDGAFSLGPEYLTSDKLTYGCRRDKKDWTMGMLALTEQRIMTMGDLGNSLGGNESLRLAEIFPAFQHALLPCSPSIAQSSLLTELVLHEMALSGLHGPPRPLTLLYTDLLAIDCSWRRVTAPRRARYAMMRSNLACGLAAQQNRCATRSCRPERRTAFTTRRGCRCPFARTRWLSIGPGDRRPRPGTLDVRRHTRTQCVECTSQQNRRTMRSRRPERCTASTACRGC